MTNAQATDPYNRLSSLSQTRSLNLSEHIKTLNIYKTLAVMSDGVQRRIQFINLSSSIREERAVRRQARSHSARETHARARRLRTVNYRSSDNVRQDGRDIAVHDEDDSTTISSTGKSAERARAVFFSPVSLLASDRTDPFACYTRPFTPIEHFLLDYC